MPEPIFKCCMCGKQAEYFIELKNGAKEYLCRHCTIINENIRKSKI